MDVQNPVATPAIDAGQAPEAALDQSQTPVATSPDNPSAAPSMVQLTPEEFKAMQEGNMRNEDYQRQMQAIKTAWDGLEPYLKQYMEGGSKEGQQIPQDLIQQAQELSSLKLELEQTKAYMAQMREQKAQENFAKEQSKFASEFPEIVDEYRSIVNDLNAGKLTPEQAEIAAKNTPYYQIYQMAIQYANMESPSLAQRGIKGQPFSLMDAALIVLGQSAFSELRGYKTGNRVKREEWGNGQGVRGAMPMAEPMSDAEAKEQIKAQMARDYPQYFS